MVGEAGTLGTGWKLKTETAIRRREVGAPGGHLNAANKPSRGD